MYRNEIYKVGDGDLMVDAYEWHGMEICMTKVVHKRVVMGFEGVACKMGE